MRGYALLLALTSLIAAPVAAQTVDAGRGPLPVIVPDSYDAGEPTPLVMLIHGYTGTGQGQDSYMQVGHLADDYGFIFVAPDGTTESNGSGNQFWNASTACCNFHGSDVDDVAYLSDLIAALKEQYTIDDKRVFLFGHSNGGFMSYLMAHERSQTIAAIASLAGADQTEERPAPPEPVHILQIHGTADDAISYEPGEFIGGGHPGAVETVENWAAHNGCAVEGVDSGTLDLEANLAGAESTVTRYTDGCHLGGSAELWTIQDGGHVPQFSPHFSRLVIEWLLGHPKP